MRVIYSLLFAAAVLNLTVNAQWERKRTGMLDQTVSSLLSHNDTLYAGVNTTVYRSSNFADTWVESGGGLPSFPAFMSIVRSGGVFVAGGEGSGVWRSSNGADWVQVTAGISASASVASLTAEGSTLYAGLGSPPAVGISTDAGSTWTVHTGGLPASNRMSGVASIGDTLYAMHQILDLYRSTDDGDTWERTGGAVGAQDKNAMIASGASLIVAATNGVWVSTDGGENFTNTNPGTIKTGLSAQGSAVYSVGYSLHRTTDHGMTWSALDTTGLPSAVWSTLQIAGGYAFVNMYGSGTYRAPLDQITSAGDPVATELPTACTLQQNYPNPFNPTTLIRFDIPVQAQVRLAIYDMLGREVAVLLNDRVSAGRHQVEFGGGGLASGAYLCRLTSGSFVATRTMLLLR